MPALPALKAASYTLHLASLPHARLLEQVALATVTPKMLSWQQAEIATAFFGDERTTFSEQPTTQSQRLLALLDALLAKMPARPAQQIVYLLLPEFNSADDALLSTFLHQLMRNHPELLQSPQCRVFPYGATASVMALKAAAELLAQPEQQKEIWFIAVDSLNDEAVFSRYAAEQSATEQSCQLLSEGAIALYLTASDTGLQLAYAASDAQLEPSTDDDMATAGLLRQTAQLLSIEQAQLSLICLPDSGNDYASQCWLNQMSQLNGVVTEDTQYLLPGYQIGELGACGGLYRLLLLLHQAQQGRVSGLILQYEQSLRRYRGVALYQAV
ncbi:hypothetical protein [Rheinheimera nanhaiensis]|uniref:Beta-ketoacyl synthase N-terminal domain-containing protein n=1 Tax=Rheinheimera nanhaiensis E407-8 TaxID=562729 RepID=I1DYB9_9GAMM|nr:hypothetical protein [Rheinheimera nanhaiensis]GAB59047.1 hypothetical protein RNAN_2037 [Rheinheimera nanhaiensis E407-8]